MADCNFQAPSFIPLAEALAQLPLESPNASAWPLLQARLQAASKRRTHPRWPWAAAMAASLLALALLPRGIDAPPVAADGNRALATSTSLDQLMAESARLESLVTASDPGTSSASAAVFGLELEDRLQQIDGQLAVRDLGDADRQSLWRQRVALLRDYAGFESTRRWYAAEGRSLDVALVAAY